MLQSKVNQTQALGTAGSVSRARDSYFNTVGAVCVDDSVQVGYFAQSGTNEGEIKGVKGQAVSGNIVGVVIFDEFKDGSADALTKAKGETATVLNVGNVYIESDIVAKAGQYVGVKTADGGLAFGDSTTITSAKYTGFKVVKGNASAGRGVIEITTAGA